MCLLIYDCYDGNVIRLGILLSRASAQHLSPYAQLSYAMPV